MWPFKVDTIYGADKEHWTPYLTRYKLGRLSLHVFHRGDADPDPHDHPYSFWTFPLTTYVEEVTRPTEIGEEWLLGVAPGYLKYRNVVRAWRFHHRPAEYTHRVLNRCAPRAALYDPDGYWEPEPAAPDPWVDIPGPIITLVWWSKRDRRDWGFLKLRDGRWCWQAWREYVYEGGKHAPCEPEDDGK